jgi:endonuclease YncB( thermonuclease family)
VLVVDGETLMLGNRPLRLFGLDAPGRGRTCHDGAKPLDCGNASAQVLAHLVAERGVECRLQGWDRHGRALGTCRAGGVELNASMVAAGWALADASAVPALGPIEAAARQSRRGLWADGVTPPGSWRR